MQVLSASTIKHTFGSVYLNKGRVADATDSAKTVDYKVWINWSSPSQKKFHKSKNCEEIELQQILLGPGYMF